MPQRILKDKDAIKETGMKGCHKRQQNDDKLLNKK